MHILSVWAGKPETRLGFTEKCAISLGFLIVLAALMGNEMSHGRRVRINKIY